MIPAIAKGLISSAITKVYDAVNDANKKKLDQLVNGKKAQFMKMVLFVML